MLQIRKYITELLNVYYNSMNTLDIKGKSNKIILSKERITMRIIGGKCKGTKLYTLQGQHTRPTQDRVREALFNILQFHIQDSVFLDLFAGSGACRYRSGKQRGKKSCNV